jgi:hypothetical protein
MKVAVFSAKKYDREFLTAVKQDNPPKDALCVNASQSVERPRIDLVQIMLRFDEAPMLRMKPRQRNKG